MKTTPGHILLSALRTRAEAQLLNQPPPATGAPEITAQMQNLLLELQTHQLELEMQNEELVAAHLGAEHARNEYADLFEQAPVPYVTLSAEGLIERVNQRACQLLAAPDASRLVARRFLAFVAPISRNAAADWLAQLQAGAAQPATIELQLLTDTGSPLIAQLDGVVRPGPAAHGCRLTLLDMSERHRAAAALRRSQERTRLALAASGAGVVEWDCATHMLYLDELARNLFGLPGPAGRLPLRDVQARVLPEDQSALTTALNRAVAGESLALEFRVRAEPEPPRYLAAHGEIIFEAGMRLHLIGQVRDVTARRQAQEEADALRLNQQKAVFEAVLAAQEEERRRMAETLHNGVGQLLYLTKLRLAQGTGVSLEPAIRLLDEAIRDVRTLSAELAPSVLEDFGLKAALETMAKRVPKQQLRVQCNFQGLDGSLPPTLQTLIYRMVQELLNNVIKHAAAEEVFLHVVREADQITVNVDDDGQGFEGAASHAEASGIGLTSIRSQVARLGGQLHITSHPGCGTAVSIVLPTTTVLA